MEEGELYLMACYVIMRDQVNAGTRILPLLVLAIQVLLVHIGETWEI